MNKQILLFLFILSTLLLPQGKNEQYEQALYDYSRGAFSAAYPKFKNFTRLYESNNPLAASAQYYAADCLYRIGDNSGAVFEFEKVVKFHQLSNFREESLYKLGLLYFNLAQYEKCRSRLAILIDTYPENEHYGAALYWLGEAFTVEQKYDEARAFFEQAIQNKRNNKFLDYSIYTLASIYEKTGDYKKAVEFYDLLLSYYKSSSLVSSAQIRIGYCYFKMKEYESSIIELSNPVIQSLPEAKQAEALYMLGNSLFRVGDYDKARGTLQELIKRFPENTYLREINYTLAWCNFQQKKYADSYKVFHQLSDGADSIARLSLYWKAESQRYLGNDNDALKMYQEFIKRYPSSPMAQGVQYQVGVIYYNNKMYEKAGNFLSSASSSQDTDVKTRSLILLGEIELNRNKYTASLKYLSMAKTIPGLSEELANRVLLGLGAASFYTNKYDDAIKHLSSLDQKFPNFENDKVQFYLGECRFQKDEFTDALTNYKKVNPNHPELGASALYGVAYCYYNLKDYDNAGYSFNDLLKKYPNDSRAVDSRMRLADTYLAAKRYADASKMYNEILHLKAQVGNKDYLTYQYGLTLFKAGKVQQALSEFNKMLSQFPRSPYTENSLYMMGWIRFQQGKQQEAINSYLYLASYAPKSKLIPLAYYSIGDAYYNMGSYDSSIMYYNRVVKNYPGSTYIFDAVNGMQLCYIAKGEVEQASALIDEFTNSSKAGYADQLFYKKGEMYFNQGNYVAAIESYHDFIKRYPKSKLASKAYYGIAKSSQLGGDNAGAKEYFRTVFDRYPGSEEAVSAVVEAGKIYSAEGNYNGAIALYDEAIKKIQKEQARAEFLYNKGMNLNSKGDPASAYDVFDEVVIYYDGTVFADKARLELGLIELKAKRFTNASKYLTALHSKRTDDLGAAAQFYAGQMLIDQGKHSEAVTAFVRILNSYPNYEEWVTRSYLKLAGCYESMKDKKKAKEMYKLVLDKHKDDIYGKEAQQKLKRLK
ncbi:MAG: tetratricopeptide repeat protein [Ignavibacteriales bacterium]|nr:tetratricopeptide repeat protein [Ignavibacteriales bacterium]